MKYNWQPPNFEVAKSEVSAEARSKFISMIEKELDRAYDLHTTEYWNRHAFWGIFEEEVEEMWDEITADSPPEKLLKEMVQAAAMILRFVETNPVMVTHITEN